MSTYTTTNNLMFPPITTYHNSSVVQTGISTPNLQNSGYWLNTLGGGTLPVAQTSLIELTNNGKEIVRVNLDGTVSWAQDIQIDEAAKAFEQSVMLGAEQKAHLTMAVKLRMRDSVFESLIDIAREKGALTVEDLTYLLEASKIVEKLKGVR